MKDLFKVSGDRPLRIHDRLFAIPNSVSGPTTTTTTTTTTTGWTPTLNCSGGTEPSMGLTVTGSVTKSVSWCGEVWNLPADSGVTKEVCPDSYVLNTTTNQGELWVHYAANGFWMERDLVTGSNGVFSYMSVRPSSVTYLRSRVTISYGSINNPTTNASIATPFYNIYSGPRPTISDYRLPNSWFNSMTDTSGITYAWQRGSNW